MLVNLDDNSAKKQPKRIAHILGNNILGVTEGVLWPEVATTHYGHNTQQFKGNIRSC